MAFWLVKTEPGIYSWDDLVQDGSTYWDGVRSYQARNNLRAMKVGELVLYYHSVKARVVVGVARVTAGAYRDPTADEGDDRWVVVDLEPVAPLDRPVSLAEIKADPVASSMVIVKHTRLSVAPVTEAEFRRILELSGTTLP